MIYKLILSIYITSWIYLVVETIRVWKYNDFHQLKAIPLVAKITMIIITVLLSIILLVVAPITCLYYGWRKSQGQILGTKIEVHDNGVITGTTTSIDEDKKNK